MAALLTRILVIVLLVKCSIAGRLDRVARHKGFHPNALRDQEAARRRGIGLDSNTTLRYHNAHTESAFHLQILQAID
jgi:hypothetical protein